MAEFTLTAPPPSVNAMYANAARSRIKTRKYKNWIKGELNSLLAQRAKPVPWPVEIRIVLPATLRGDIDNRVKGILDLLVSATIIPNDANRYVHKVTVSRGSESHTRVRIDSIPPDASCAKARAAS